MSHFKKLTMGGAVIFGRKTFEGIGRELPGRLNIVVSRSWNERNSTAGDAPGSRPSVRTAGTIQEAAVIAHDYGCRNIFICGGQQLYQEGLLFAEKIFATELNAEISGDTFFPQIPSNIILKEESRILQTASGYSFDYVTYSVIHK